jgi:hypothetical protein
MSRGIEEAEEGEDDEENRIDRGRRKGIRLVGRSISDISSMYMYK